MGIFGFFQFCNSFLFPLWKHSFHFMELHWDFLPWYSSSVATEVVTSPRLNQS
jgi:hypothetical protein